MAIDPLLPHLIDILSQEESRDLILAGGFGISVKQSYLRSNGEQTLFEEVPLARATQDLDFFLFMELFTRTQNNDDVRRMLERLNYEEDRPKFKFRKPMGSDHPERHVVVDLMARSPTKDEAVKADATRVGRKSPSNIHGRNTPEAFAIEDAPLRVALTGMNSNRNEIAVNALVPHPYAWINMKVRAAHDWHARNLRGEYKKFSEKHAFDVFVLVAMLTSPEIESARFIAPQYAHNEVANSIKAEATVLFSEPGAPGFIEASRQAGTELDHATFFEGLQQVLSLDR